jgi:hypothetical protein
MGRSGKKKR